MSNVHQQTSVGHLVISGEGLKHLVSLLDIFPAFLDLAQCFGKKEISDPNAFVAPLDRRGSDGSLKESCFLLKHVERHERDETDGCWSIRQMGVYLQSSQNNTQHTIVLLNPVRRFYRRYFEVSKKRSLSLADVETLLFSTCFRNWSEYMDELEKKIKIKIDSAFATSIDGDHPLSFDWRRREIEIKPNDVHDLAYLRHKLEMVATSLESNEKVLSNRVAALGLEGNDRAPSLTAVLGNLQLRRRSLQEKLSDASSLVHTTLQMKNNQMSMETTALARKDTVATLGMQKSQMEEGRVLKIIAILGLLYLPASFVAQLLSMDNIHISPTGPVKLYVDREFIVFVIMTFVLLLITALVWLATDWVQKRQKRNRKHRDQGCDSLA